MIGIYKITNNINKHCYIGQSRNIYKRWNDEKSASNNPNEQSYNYPLSRAFRKYGIQNFTFEVIEECALEELNDKECYWINTLNPEYNQTSGGDYQAHGKLTYNQVQEIQQILIDDKDGKILHTELAKQYNVSPDTIQAINVGRSWVNSKLTYPLHLSVYDSRRPTKKYYCIDCGKLISLSSIRCLDCEIKHKRQNRPVTREVLKKMIRTMSFIKIGEYFGVSDNAIRKWCIAENLPSKKKEINSYSDEEWEKI